MSIQNLKKLILGVIATVIVTGSAMAQQSTITVSGSVEFPDDRFPIYVYHMKGDERINIDSIELRSDNTFKKQVTLPEPGPYTLDMQRWERVTFWGEDEPIDVDFRGQDTAKIKIKNPPYVYINNPGPNNELVNLLNFYNYRGYQDMLVTAREVYQAGQSESEAWSDYMKEGYGRLNERNQAYIDFLGKYYGNRNSAVMLLPRLQEGDIKNQVIMYFETENPDYLPYTALMEAQQVRAERMSRLQKGMVAPAFSLPTPDGKSELGTSSYRGKYLLIDFWASWCGPCIASIPKIKELYNTYQPQGFDVLSVSIDSKEDAWHGAMADLNMPWGQVLAPDAGKQIRTDYQFNGIPHLVLLDKEGKIIERNLTVENLKEKLVEIFDQ